MPESRCAVGLKQKHSGIGQCFADVVHKRLYKGIVVEFIDNIPAYMDSFEMSGLYHYSKTGGKFQRCETDGAGCAVLGVPRVTGDKRKNPPSCENGFLCFGALEGIRIPDLPLRRRTLYPAELQAHIQITLQVYRNRRSLSILIFGDCKFCGKGVYCIHISCVFLSSI